MREKLTLAVVVLFLLPCAANADFSLEQYRTLSQSSEIKEKFRDYVTGVGRGIFWANVMLGVQKKERLFCMPTKLSLDEGIIQSLLDQEIRAPSKGTAYKNDTPIELIMTSAFIRRFPCDK